MRIDRLPDRLPALVVLRQHVPDVAYPLLAGTRTVMQHHRILAASPMPTHYRPLTLVAQIFPQRQLVVTRRPVIRQRDYFFRHVPFATSVISGSALSVSPTSWQ